MKTMPDGIVVREAGEKDIPRIGDMYLVKKYIKIWRRHLKKKRKYLIFKFTMRISVKKI